MTTTPRILITPRSLTQGDHPALAPLARAGFTLVKCTAGKQPDEAELVRLVPGCAGYLAGVEPVSRKVLEAARELKVISRNGTGINNVDLAAAKELNIKVMAAAGANARGVAELALGLMLALVRSLPWSDHHLKQAGWERRKGIELAGRTLGLVGCGAIGQMVARMALGLDMRVLGYDPMRQNPSGMEGFRYTSLDEVLQQADVVSLHCPPPADGKPLMDAARLAQMKAGAYLINTARGELLDDQAVLAALNSGRLAGVALDAFRKEPPGVDPLVQHDKVIASPHIGAFTNESVERAVEVAVTNLLTVLRPGGTGVPPVAVHRAV